MLFSNPTFRAPKPLLIFAYMLAAPFALAQKTDSLPKILNLRGSITATSNGFSFVPTFSLGKPALMTSFGIGGRRERFSFEPNLWYSMLDFKPWSLIMIWRYKLVKREKFQFAIGTHAPAVNFRSATVIENGVEKEVVKARRFYPAVELIPVYNIKKNVALSVYFLFGTGIEKEVSSKNTFVSLRPDFNRIPLPKRWFFRLNPQFYYLRIDDLDGVYAAAGLTLVRRDCPISISTLVNQKLKSDIVTKNFDWNVSLTFAFDQKFKRQ